jgi:hypothetical protein
MLTNFLGVLPILNPPLCAKAFIMCSKSNPLVVFLSFTFPDPHYTFSDPDLCHKKPTCIPYTVDLWGSVHESRVDDGDVNVICSLPAKALDIGCIFLWVASGSGWIVIFTQPPPLHSVLCFLPVSSSLKVMLSPHFASPGLVCFSKFCPQICKQSSRFT